MPVQEKEKDTQATAVRGLSVGGWLRWGWRQLTSMRTALVLLFLLALAAIPGSVLPQRNQAAEKVQEYFDESPGLARVLDSLSLFDVFASPWFAATYLLLFASLVGCVLPRTKQHYLAMRRKPPAAPRNLSRLPYSASFEGDMSTEAVASALRKERFRVATGSGGGGRGAGHGWVAAEKGYLREIGNLVFHIALIGVLAAFALGSLYGYRGNVLLIEDDGFANAVPSYDQYEPGAAVTPPDLQPFAITLESFQARYETEEPRRGQALDYNARLRVQDTPGSAERAYNLRPNEPLVTNGAQVYLLGNGYAPTFRVTDGKGDVAFEGAVPCLVTEQRNMGSECVIKAADAQPEQLAFQIQFLPTAVRAPFAPMGYASGFPGPENPAVSVLAFKGDIGLDTGVPQSVYTLESESLENLKVPSDPITQGESVDLPGGAGKIEFTGVKRWVSLQVTHDPGQLAALVSVVVAVIGLVLSLYVRRRRIWVRLGASTVEVGGLPKTDGDAGFGEEFEQIVGRLRGHQ